VLFLKGATAGAEPLGDDPMILSAYTVDTTTVGFTPCWWPATSLGAATAAAKSLSERLGEDERYPNPFWVVDADNAPVCKFYRGKKYAPSESV
jgi:hypothetical protein